MTTTNVRPTDLNYHHYSNDKYDRDIINSIPFHKELHQRIVKYLRKNFSSGKNYSILDLGAGTGITSGVIKNELPNVELTLVDFSRQMMAGAKKRLGETAKYIFADYAKLKFNKKYDIIVSVVSIHHQNHRGKKLLFKKIYSSLKPNGVFIFGDLVSYKDPAEASLNFAKHLHRLVEKSTDEKTLKEWAHHYCVVNDLAPVEDQIDWLKTIGFTVKLEMLKMNTALLICKK